MPAVEAAAIEDVADQLFAAIERSDTAAARRLWNDDVAVWKVGEPGDRDRERALRVIDWFVTTTAERPYEILDRQLFDAVSSNSTSCTRRAATAHRSRCGSASWSSWVRTV